MAAALCSIKRSSLGGNEHGLTKTLLAVIELNPGVDGFPDLALSKQQAVVESNGEISRGYNNNELVSKTRLARSSNQDSRRETHLLVVFSWNQRPNGSNVLSLHGDLRDPC